MEINKKNEELNFTIIETRDEELGVVTITMDDCQDTVKETRAKRQSLI